MHSGVHRDCVLCCACVCVCEGVLRESKFGFLIPKMVIENSFVGEQTRFTRFTRFAISALLRKGKGKWEIGSHKIVLSRNLVNIVYHAASRKFG